jgi:hypothetical protein
MTASNSRLSAAAALVCAVGLASAAPAQGDEPGFGGYFGLASEYPPGMCIDVPDTILIDIDDLSDLSPISCDNGGRDYRVVQQAATPADCTAQVDDVYYTTDGVVLCVVRDY